MNPLSNCLNQPIHVGAYKGSAHPPLSFDYPLKILNWRKKGKWPMMQGQLQYCPKIVLVGHCLEDYISYLNNNGLLKSFPYEHKIPIDD